MMKSKNLIQFKKKIHLKNKNLKNKKKKKKQFDMCYFKID